MVIDIYKYHFRYLYISFPPLHIYTYLTLQICIDIYDICRYLYIFFKCTTSQMLRSASRRRLSAVAPRNLSTASKSSAPLPHPAEPPPNAYCAARSLEIVPFHRRYCAASVSHQSSQTTV